MLYACLCHFAHGLLPLLYVFNINELIFYEDNVLRALQNVPIYDLWEFEYDLIKPL